MQNNFLITIIMPVFNTEKYIHECLNSVLNQTIDKYEVICIDDCSEDNSKQIIKEYMNNNSQIRLIENKTNKGLSAVRNIGIKNARGKYILFLDSDDIIREDTLETVSKKAEQFDADIVQFDYHHLFEKGVEVWQREDKCNYHGMEGLYNGKEFFTELVANHVFEGQVCFRLFRTEFLHKNNLSFYEGILHEDYLFSFLCFMKAEKVVCCDQDLYTYRKHPKGITNRKDLHKSLSYFISFLEVWKYWNNLEESEELSNAITVLARYLFDMYVSNIGSNDLNEKILLGNQADKWLYGHVSSYLKPKHEYIQLTEEIINKAQKYDRVYIYGAGNYGKELYDKLADMNIYVEGFIVSDNNDPNDLCRGRHVFSINSLKIDPDELIIIAVSYSKLADIVSILEKKQVFNYISVNPIPVSMIEDIWKCMPVCSKKIFFDTFHGLGYMCNPKYIAEELLRRNADVDIVWDVTDDANMEFPEGVRTVRRGEPEFYREYYTSHIVVTNMNSVYGPKKRTGQYFINTWHGTGPFKKVGKFVYDITGNTAAYEAMKEEYANVDMATAACEQCFVNHRQAFEYEGEIQKWGYPRNDIFFRDPEPIRNKVFESLGLDKNEKMVLYAPTFRYSIKDKTKDLSEIYDIELYRIATALSAKFDSHFRTVYRFHQYIFRELKVTDYYPGSIDATMYPDMQELLVAADVLVTDWSSSIWDYSLTGKPVFLYFHDEQDALKESGFYVQPDDLPYPKGHSNDELCEEIRNFDLDEYAKHVKGFVDQYGSYDDGHASERIADRIMEIIGDR